ncbi:uncharacterized protein TNCV_4972841 [Trichonephila clavipes]|nr:uncharacterized protein TNCV_4972841 [Trichonephila clavipes]
MITNFFIPQLNNHDVQELWFQQDGATCHTARATIDLLKDTFSDRLISRFGPVNWPPRSCDLTPLDYFLWGYVNSLVYTDKPQTLDHLDDNIRRVIADIRPQMLKKVIENWTSRLDYIRASRGSPMPEIIFKIRVISSDSKECDPRTPRCLPPSSNLLKRAKTREINTWYPIPRHRILFDTRKNSRGGRFASNFNKPSPTRADGYPHANDFPRSSKKGKIAEEFGIRFGSLTDDQSRMELERLAKLNDTAGGEEALFVLSSPRQKLSAVPGLEGGYHVNNSSSKVNSTKKNDGAELFENLEIQLSDTVSSNTSNVSDSPIEFLSEQITKNVSANASVPLDAAHNSRTIKIAVNYESNLDFSIANSTEEHESEFQNNAVTPFPSTENITPDDLNSNEGIKSNENYSSKLIASKYGTIVSIGNFRAIEVDGIEIPIFVATLHLKIKDKNRTRQHSNRQQPDLIIFKATDSLKDKAFQNRRKRSSINLKTYTMQDSGENLKYFQVNYSNLSTDKKISTDVLKIFNISNIPKLNSGKSKVEIRNRNKRAARAGASPEMQKFYQRNDGADLSSESSTMFRISDNAPVVVESYQTGTLVRGRVPLLSNELPQKNNSVSDEGRKKSELQIYKEDSFDKDLGASKMETGIGDQLRNDVKEGESKGGRYIYIRLRNLHSSLRESGNNKIQRISEETSFESSGNSDLRKRVLRMYKPNGFATVSLRSNNETIKRVVNDEWKMRRSIIGKTDIKGNNEVDNEIFTPLKYLEKEKGHFENNKRYPYQKLSGNDAIFDHDSDNQLNESTNLNQFNFEDINRSVNNTRIENNVTGKISESITLNGTSKQNTLLYLIRNVNAIRMNRQKRHLRAENKERFKANDIHTFHRQNGVNLGHILGFLIDKPISRIQIGAKKGEQLRPVQSSLLRSNVYFFEGSQNRLLNLFDSNTNSDKRGNHLPTDKIRGLFRFAGRRADRFNIWRIIGRSATPKRNLIFSSYSRNSDESASRPSTRLREWIRANIYKEKVSLRTPKMIRNSPEIQEEDPRVLLLLILPSDESNVSESAALNDRTAFPNSEIKNLQIETEDYDEMFIKQTSNMTVSEDSISKPQPRNVKGRNKPNIGEKYARFVNDENSDRDRENESRTGIQDWLDSQWIYINSINTTGNLSTTTEIPSFLPTEAIPSYTSVPEHTTESVSNRAAQTRAPIRTTIAILSTRALNIQNMTANPNDTDTTKKPESIQNMPTTVKPWSNPHYPWGKPFYNPWEETKTPWDHPVNPWQVTQKPWNPPVITWKTRKPWIPPVDPWETVKKPWVPPVNPWQATRKPWIPPVDPWEKAKKPWNPPDNIWKVTEKPWIPPVDPWEKTKRPWNPPADPWEKNLPWNPPKDLWQENKRPRNKPINVWQITQKPWIPPNTAWHATERPWTPQYDPWHLVERPGNPPDHPWRMLPKPWNQPDNSRKVTRPWNLPGPWQINNKPSNPPNNPRKLIKNNRGLSNDSWKMNIPWWDCSEWLLPYEAWRI